MKKIKKDKLEYYIFENISVRHCFSTRLGGVSEGVHASLNLGFREDKRENVLKNYDIICSAIGVEKENTFWTKQVHEDNIVVAHKDDRGKGLLRERTVPEGYDAIITNEKDIVLTGFSADCVLVFMHDPVQNAVAICHSGWRSTVKQIVPKVLNKMKKEFGCESRNIHCAISPAIGKECFQVGEEVSDEFIKVMPFALEYIMPDAENGGKRYIDLHGVIERQLRENGVTSIDNSRLCTMCHPEEFFSHRIMGNERGSMAGLISL